ncbi:MAG: threonine--tRNA ligase [Planctomycetota bacterium]
MVNIRLPDGQPKQYPDGVSAEVVLADLQSGAQETPKPIGAKIDGRPADLGTELHRDACVEPITAESDGGRELIRHSAAHVMAQAVLRLWPDARLAIGPATEDGFYYDIDLDHRLTDEDLPRIQAQMEAVRDEALPFQRLELPAAEARETFQKQGNPYKVELIDQIAEQARAEGDDRPTVSTYTNGEFTDLCRGPHVPTTADIGAFRLLSVAGAYWRGDEQNKMLQRIYGTAFATQAELDEHLRLLEEAKTRDHRRLGTDLELYSVDPLVGPGLILWHPRGARVRTLMEDFWREEHYAHGYELVYTPHIGRLDLWEQSGHTGFYQEYMFAPTEVDERQYQIKPMNCPFHICIYKSRHRSYREFPIRWAELGTVYRYEKSGVLQGLFRVRGFTQDDAHVFCRVDQLDAEIQHVLDFTLHILRTFGFDEFQVALSTQPEKFVGEQANWDQSTDALRRALAQSGLDYVTQEGEGAFYGPKIDVNIQDALRRVHQCTTIQVDFNIPERFDLTYVGSDGDEHRPIMIHRALMGSVERFFGCLVEHYGGAFPLWLAPVQAVVLPITDEQAERAEAVRRRLAEAGIRAECDDRSQKLGAKIREHTTQKVPYLLIVGAREVESGNVSVRKYKIGDVGAMSVDTLLAEMQEAIASKATELPAASD